MKTHFLNFIMSKFESTINIRLVTCIGKILLHKHTHLYLLKQSLVNGI